jgi:hypothetical protein
VKASVAAATPTESSRSSSRHVFMESIASFYRPSFLYFTASNRDVKPDLCQHAELARPRCRLPQGGQLHPLQFYWRLLLVLFGPDNRLQYDIVGTLGNGAWGYIVGTYDKDAGTNNQRLYLNGARHPTVRGRRHRRVPHRARPAFRRLDRDHLEQHEQPGSPQG